MSVARKYSRMMLHTGVLLCGAGPALAGHYVYTTLDVPGGSDTRPQSISQSGDVGGVYVAADGTQQGFVLSRGAYTTFTAKQSARQVEAVVLRGHGSVALMDGKPKGGRNGVFVRSRAGHIARLTIPGAMRTVLSAASPAGDVAGLYYTDLSGGQAHGFLADGATLQTLDLPGAADTYPQAVDAAGTVVGDAMLADRIDHGFIEQNGQFSIFDPPQSAGTFPGSINRSGTIAGVFFRHMLGGKAVGFTYSHGTFALFENPDRREKQTIIVYAVSDRQVVGTSGDSAGYHGINIVDRTYYVTEPAGAVSSDLTGANEAGTLIGNYVDSAGQTHGFMAVCPAGEAPCTN